MNKINKKLFPYAIQTADILIPKENIDLRKWAVVACDQYSSQPEYWQKVKEEVGSSPSTLNLIFPECYLNKGNDKKIIASINNKMNQYYQEGIFQEIKESFILVKREFKSKKIRYGLMVLLDLDQYDFNKNSTTLIRATEKTIVERIPPRLEIRKEAILELPHIMVLVDDQKSPLITPFVEWTKNQKPLYSSELLQEGGTVSGYLINDEKMLKAFTRSLKILSNKSSFKKKYKTSDLLLFAIGDGNHSLATAKAAWGKLKEKLPLCEQKNHPARYALVELNSIYDEGIEFEPIHRLLFNADGELFLQNFLKTFDCTVTPIEKEKLTELAAGVPEKQQFALIVGEKNLKVEINNPDSSLTVGTLQPFLDEWLKNQTGVEMDFIHGVATTCQLASKKGNFGIILPNISKSDFFNTVIQDGSFPRKTFSMGEAHEKRFYFEARKITL